MIQIENGFKDFYCLFDDKVYNSKTKRFLKPDKNNVYTLMKKDNTRGRVTYNTLLKLVYGNDFAIDNIKSFDGEEWKQIKSGYPYFISSFGRLKSNHFAESKLLSFDTSCGYARVHIDLGFGQKNYLVHKLVAEKFLDAPKEPFMEIHHLDLDPYNNFYKNLMYCTRDEHIQIHKNLRNGEKNNA